MRTQDQIRDQAERVVERVAKRLGISKALVSRVIVAYGKEASRVIADLEAEAKRPHKRAKR
jgi:hypothetical protein